MDYLMILHWNDDNQFMEEVEKAIADGYTLQGGISVHSDTDGNVGFAQALVKAK